MSTPPPSLPSGRRSPLTLDAVWLSVPLAAGLFFTLVQPLYPNDTWWPLVQARATWQLGHLPVHNLYLYTVERGAGFLNQPWLAEQGLLGLVRLGGVEALIWGNALCTVAAFGWAMWGGVRAGAKPRAAALWTTMSALVAANVLTVRTQMFALVCFVGVLWTVRQAALMGWSRGRVIGVVALTCVWANLHGSFVLSWVMVAGTWVMVAAQRAPRGEQVPWRQWAMVGAGVVLASVCHPHGVRVIAYTWQLSTQFGQGGGQVTEWEPLAAWGWKWAMVCGAGVFGAVSVWRARAQWWEGALWVGFCAMAISSERHLVWWALSGPLLVAPHLGVWGRGRGEKDGVSQPVSQARGLVHRGMVLGLFGLVLACAPGGPGHDVWARREVARDDDTVWLGGAEGPWKLLNVRHPVGLVGRVRRAGWRVFHEQSIGGYLEWELAGDAPGQVAFVDQRFSMIPEQVWEEYFRVSSGSAGWEDVLARYGVDALLVDVWDQAGLCRAALGSPGWALVGGEGRVRLFVRPEKHDGKGGQWRQQEACPSGGE